MYESMRRRMLVGLIGAACGAFACGGPELCDGSDQIRWAARDGFGGREWAPALVAEYGQRSVSIDGQCQFWLYDASQRGLRRGAIAPALAHRIEDWTHYGSYASLYDRTYEQVCLDETPAWVADGTATLSGGCISDAAPSGWREAVHSVDTVSRALDAIAQRVWRPVQILPIPVSSAPSSQPIYDWNAPFELAAYAVTEIDDPRLDRDATGIPVDDPAVLERLDELRAADIAADDAAHGARVIERGLFVRDVEGRIFQVFIRDEQPEGIFANPASR